MNGMRKVNNQALKDPLATLITLDGVGIPAFICHMDTIIKHANHQFSHILEIDQDILEGLALYAVGGFGTIAEAITRQDRWDDVVDCTTGKTYWQARLYQLADDQCLVVLQDVTDYRERENFQRDAMHMVAHDLKTPISVVKSYADLIKQLGDMNPQQNQFLDRIKTAVTDMSGLVIDLLDLTWIDTNSPLNREETRIEFLVKTSVESLQIRARKENIDIDLVYEENLPLILADPDRLRRVFGNLLSNAIKFSPAGSRIKAEVSNCPADHQVCVTISDNGPGIPPEHLPHIFDRFYQAPRPDGEKRIRGSGLGLAIVQGLVEKHGGIIEVSSVMGEGTEFKIYLPTQPIR